MKTVSPNNKQPFAGDALERKNFSKKIERTFSDLNSNNVICIDGEWGEGKSWLTREWIAQREFEGKDSVYIDASATDHMDDPFIPLAASLIAKVKEAEPKTALTQKAAGIAKGMAPLLSKVLIKTISKTLTGDGSAISELSTEILDGCQDTATDSLSALITDKLKTIELEAQSATELKELIGNIFDPEEESERKAPLVVFIDELDRCRPDYAIKFLERIKFLFGVRGVVFILLIDVTQLKEAIKGIYGKGFDTNKYLNKFVNLFFMLNASGEGPLYREAKYRQAVKLYLSSVKNYWGAMPSCDADFAKWMDQYGRDLQDFCAFSVYFSLSQREMERVMGYLSAGGYSFTLRRAHYFVPLIVKVRNYDLYREIVSSKNGHCKKFANYIRGILAGPKFRDPESPEIILLDRYVQAAEAFENGGEEGLRGESGDTWIGGCGWELLQFMNNTYFPDRNPTKSAQGHDNQQVKKCETERACQREYSDDEVEYLVDNLLKYVGGGNDFNPDLFPQEECSEKQEEEMIQTIQEHATFWKERLTHDLRGQSFLTQLFLAAENFES